MRIVEEPALYVPAGLYAVRVRYFMVDDYSRHVLGRAVARVALGTLVHGPRSLLGKPVVAVGDNVAGEVAVVRDVAVVESLDPRYLLAPYVDQVARVVARVPRGVPISVVGSDPRRLIVSELAEVGSSRWVIAVEGGELGGVGCRGYVLSWRVGLGDADMCVVRLLRRVRASSRLVGSIDVEVVDADAHSLPGLIRGGKWVGVRLKF